ncbi:MAG: efflux RND transporter periplasmic adaptor subunit [Acidobacteriota bacterium]|nr:efflux RND transporter periplasmic adaptor subunit [Acidobacteriota bacterium]
MNTIQRILQITFLLSFGAGALAGCHGGDTDDRAEAQQIVERALAPREVRLVMPEVRNENPGVQLVGEIRAFDTVTMSSEIAGKVDKVLAEVGDRVSAGSPLAEVDRETFMIYLQQAEANLAAAKAELALAEKELDRKKDLRSDETISQAALDQAMAAHDLATARVAAANAALDLARRNYDRSIIRAPAAGAITQRHVVAGQWAEVGVGLFELAVGNKVKVAARVPAAWAPKLAGLEQFTFSIGVADTTRTAKVYSMQPVVEEASRSFEIVGTAVNDGSMKPGMFANVTFESPTVEQSVWLPASAVATSDLPQVLMVENDAVAFRTVQIGRRVDGMIEIVGGLSPDEAVVADVSGLSRGIPVTVIE